ncbi:MAG TPA: RES family NAD+ phosphorylase [Acidimicrobiales bacterium]|nr:RES family NAD+ phosphorylase [Acidimicrobiales bacterium]
MWYRHVPRGKGVLRTPPIETDGRWQHGSVATALYLADTPATALAEWYRWLAESEIPPGNTLPRDLWSIEVDVEVADLSTAERLEEWGLARPEPDRQLWPSYQAVGERIWRDGWAGLIAPSAALPAGLVLCLFSLGTSMERVRPLASPHRWDELPPPPRGMRT